MFQSKVDSDFALETRGLRKVYGARKKSPAKEALKGLDLAVEKGTIFGLLGPNGAGKSTMINILAGLVRKTEGAARIWGYDIDKNPRQARAAIGVVPQEISIDPFFTPRECLEIQAGLYGVRKAERRTDEILDLVDLTDKAGTYVRQLSGGMKRRLLVAKAMVHDPPILVLDEPTAGVDIELRRQLWAAVRRLNERGVTIILTTHYLEEAEQLCDRVAIIHHGRLVADAATPDLIGELDRKTLLITPCEPLTALPSGLESLDARVTPGGRLEVDYRPSATQAHAILAQLHEAGVKIHDLSTREADLEDVFLELTYGTAPQDG